MYQKDYVLRMIEMIRELIMGILGLINKGELDKAGEKIDILYYDFLKEDAAFFTLIPSKELTKKLIQEHNYTHGHLEILAWLFDAEAELELARGNNGMSLEFSQKAWILFEFVENEQKSYSFDREEKLKMIRNRIKSLKEDGRPKTEDGRLTNEVRKFRGAEPKTEA
jgi:hypothetical protein